MDLQNSQYFHSLPVFVQENMMQSGIDFQNEGDLQQFASNLYAYKTFKEGQFPSYFRE